MHGAPNKCHKAPRSQSPNRYVFSNRLRLSQCRRWIDNVFQRRGPAVGLKHQIYGKLGTLVGPIIALWRNQQKFRAHPTHPTALPRHAAKTPCTVGYRLYIKPPQLRNQLTPQSVAQSHAEGTERNGWLMWPWRCGIVRVDVRTNADWTVWTFPRRSESEPHRGAWKHARITSTLQRSAPQPLWYISQCFVHHWL